MHVDDDGRARVCGEVVTDLERGVTPHQLDQLLDVASPPVPARRGGPSTARRGAVVTGRDEFTGSRTDRAGHRDAPPTGPVDRAAPPALAVALSEHGTCPTARPAGGPGTARRARRRHRGRPAPGWTPVRADRGVPAARGAVAAGRAGPAVPGRRRPPARSAHRRRAGLLLRYQRYAVEALLGTPRVGLDQTRPCCTTWPTGSARTVRTRQAVAELRCRIADHLGDEPTARHWYERWSGRRPGPAGGCPGCAPARRAELLAGWGEWRARWTSAGTDGDPERLHRPARTGPRRRPAARSAGRRAGAGRGGTRARVPAAPARAGRVRAPRHAPAVLRAGRAPGARADHPGRATTPAGPAHRRPGRDGVRRRRGAGLRAGAWRPGWAGDRCPARRTAGDPPPNRTWPASARCCSGWPPSWPAASTPATAPATTPAGSPPGSPSDRSRRRSRYPPTTSRTAYAEGPPGTSGTAGGS